MACSHFMLGVGLWFMLELSLACGFDVAYRWFNFSDYLSLDGNLRVCLPLWTYSTYSCLSLLATKIGFCRLHDLVQVIRLCS
ncbi:hypothetical protein CDL12_04399 [Handroanthus impetiginosus]|uniref:Uncharacterized protein n=1 Tax=Handroanthus impetiginosus TaxID=429701 RepID=A0A2G9HZF0_9LAMI|nr:hypothetical protein CDL12_04399 [Handroanthus impetiginosus]